MPKAMSAAKMELGHRAFGIDHWLTRSETDIPVFDPIARMLDHAISGSETRDHFRQAIVPMANLNRRHARAAVPNSKDNPPLAASEQRTNRYVNEVGNR